MTRASAPIEPLRPLLELLREACAGWRERFARLRADRAKRPSFSLFAAVACAVFYFALVAVCAQYLRQERVRRIEEEGHRLESAAISLGLRLSAIAAGSSEAPSDLLGRALESDVEITEGFVSLVGPGGRAAVAIGVEAGSASTRSAGLLGKLAAASADERPALIVDAEVGDHIAAVRRIDAKLGVIAFAEPLDLALSPWRRLLWLVGALLAAMLVLFVGGSLGYASQLRRERERRLAAAVARAHVDLALNRGRCGLWDWDMSAGAVAWSKSMFDLLGLRHISEPMPLDVVKAMVHPDDVGMFDLAAASKDPTLDFEMRFARAAGGWIWLRAQAQSVGPTTGRRVVGIAIDVTEHKLAAEASAQADRRLHEAIESISEAFVLWDSDNRLVLCNSKYSRLHRLPAEAVRPGAAYRDVAAQGEAPVVENPDAPGDGRLERGDERTYEARLADGRWLQVNERRTADGGFVSVGTDITALKEHEDQLLRSERLLLATIAQLRQSRRSLEAQAQQVAELAERYREQKGEAEAANFAKARFLANMSHELRTPLNAIIGFAELMQSQTFGPLGNPRYLEYCDHILDGGRYLMRVFQDVLDMSELESGHTALNVKEFTIGRAFDDAMSAIAEVAAHKRVRLEASIARDENLVADFDAVTRVLTTLLRNAVKFSPEGGTVDAQIVPSGANLFIHVRDSGPGIPQEDLHRIGRPFEQANVAMSNGMKGSGLGLAIAGSLVELHGGVLRVASAPGEGASVHVTLPKRPRGARTVALAEIV